MILFLVNNGEYIQAVCDRNEAENISRVLYPNDNVSGQYILNKLRWLLYDNDNVSNVKWCFIIIIM